MISDFSMGHNNAFLFLVLRKVDVYIAASKYDARQEAV